MTLTPSQQLLSYIITFNPILIPSTSGPKRREACWQGSVNRDVCVCVCGLVWRGNTSNLCLYAEEKGSFQYSHPAFRAYTQDRAVPWITACHITGHWNTLLVSLPASSATPSIRWNTAQASSTKTPLRQAWSPARGGPSILPWAESYARFTVWTSRLRAWKTVGNMVSTGPLVFCADVSSLVLCFLDLDGIKVLTHQPLLIVRWAC